MPWRDRSRLPRPVWGISLGFFAVYAAYALNLHREVRTAAYDLGIFDQAIRGYAHFHAPVVALKAPGFNLLGDHFHPVLVLLAPLYWVWDDPRMLLLAQAALVASSIPAAWLFASRALTPRTARFVAAAYGLAWGLQAMIAFDFHELAFAVPLTAWALERIQAGRWRTAVACILALLLVKEDLAMLVVMFGVYIAVIGRRRIGAALAAVGLVAYFVITKLLIPHFSGGAPFAYWTYAALGPDLQSALWFLVRHPLRSVHVALSPQRKPTLLLWLFAPTSFLAWASPIALLTIPLLAERLFSSNPNHWSVGFHYNALPMVIITFAAVDGLRRLLASAPADERARVSRRVAVAWCLVAVVLCERFSFHELYPPNFWTTSARARSAYAAMAVVPSHVLVAATNRFGPHLTPRDDVVLFDGKDYGQQYVTADIARVEYPWAGIDDARRYVHALLAAHWQVLYNHGGYVVLKRP